MMADEAVWVSVIADIKAHEGSLNVLVNNAGIAIGVFHGNDLADWQRQNAINLDGVFLGCKHAAPLMMESVLSSIINLSSVAGLQGAALSGYVRPARAAFQKRSHANARRPGSIFAVIACIRALSIQILGPRNCRYRQRYAGNDGGGRQ